MLSYFLFFFVKLSSLRLSNHFFASEIDLIVTSLILSLSILTHKASSLSLKPLHFSQSDSL